MSDTTQVLDQGFVRLVDVMGSDLSVVNAARISFAKESKKFSDKDERLMRYLWRHKHTSPFRHASLQFHIKAPIFVIRQWQKHQVGCAWNEASGRYIEFSGECYMPSLWREQHADNKQGSSGQVYDQVLASVSYDRAMESSLNEYNRLLGLGVCKEQARMVLPLSLYTECYWTASLQAVMHFLTLREDSHAQLEIQEYARAVRALAKGRFPVSLCLQTDS